MRNKNIVYFKRQRSDRIGLSARGGDCLNAWGVLKKKKEGVGVKEEKKKKTQGKKKIMNLPINKVNGNKVAPH